jgi:hypothetical protein
MFSVGSSIYLRKRYGAVPTTLWGMEYACSDNFCLCNRVRIRRYGLLLSSPAAGRYGAYSCAAL